MSKENGKVAVATKKAPESTQNKEVKQEQKQVSLWLTKINTDGKPNGPVAAEITFKKGMTEIQSVEAIQSVFVKAMKKSTGEDDAKLNKFFHKVIKMGSKDIETEKLKKKTWIRPTKGEVDFGQKTRRIRAPREAARVLMDCSYTYMSIHKLKLTSEQIDSLWFEMLTEFAKFTKKKLFSITIYFKPIGLGELFPHENIALEIIKEALREHYQEDNSSYSEAMRYISASEFSFRVKLTFRIKEAFLKSIRSKKENGEWDNASPAAVACWTTAELFGAYGHESERRRSKKELQTV